MRPSVLRVPVVRALLLGVALGGCEVSTEGREPTPAATVVAAATPAKLDPRSAALPLPAEAPAVQTPVDEAELEPAPKLRPGVDAAVDELFVDYAGEGTPGAAVMVIEHGQPVLVKTYGYARLKKAIPVESNTNFRLASVTKQFTAMAVLMLVERGKLELDDSIRTHFPQLPEFAQAITIRHILQHNSGLRGYAKLVELEFPDQISDAGVLDLMTQTSSTYFPPGSKYRYSNSGYALLAMLIEKLSGQSFASFLHANIFAPLEMDNTLAYERKISTVPNRALGYVVKETGITNSDQSLFSAVLGDGGIYSSLDDLFKWDQALYTDTLISPELKQLAFTPGLNHYGLGWRIDEYRGHARVHHGGATCGFRTFIQRFIDDQLTVIVLTNRAGPEVWSRAEAIADHYLEPKPKPEQAESKVER